MRGFLFPIKIMKIRNYYNFTSFGQTIIAQRFMQLNQYGICVILFQA
jgi:hypothetical protein